MDAHLRRQRETARLTGSFHLRDHIFQLLVRGRQQPVDRGCFHLRERYARFSRSHRTAKRFEFVGFAGVVGDVVHVEHRGRAVGAGGGRLPGQLRMNGVGAAGERTFFVELTRLVTHDDDDLAARVDARVVVVAVLFGGDAVAGEYDGARDSGARRKVQGAKVSFRRQIFGAFPIGPAELVRFSQPRARGDGERLQITAAARGRSKTPCAESVRDVVGGDVEFRCTVGAALETLARQKLDVIKEAVRVDRGRPGRRLGTRRQADGPHDNTQWFHWDVTLSGSSGTGSSTRSRAARRSCRRSSTDRSPNRWPGGCKTSHGCPPDAGR